VIRTIGSIEYCPFLTRIFIDYFELDYQYKYYRLEISQGISSYNTSGIYKRDWYPVANGTLQSLDPDFKLDNTKYIEVIVPYYLAPRKFYYIRVGASSTPSGPVEFWGERLIDQPTLPLSNIPDCCVLSDYCDEPGPRTPLAKCYLCTN